MINYFIVTLNHFNINNNFKCIFIILDILYILHNYILSIQYAILNAYIVEQCCYHKYLFKFINNTLKKYYQYSKSDNSMDRMVKYKFKLLHKVEYLHKYQCLYHLITFGQLWAYVGFIYLLVTIPFNVICILNLNNEKISNRHVTIILLMLIIQASILIYTLLSGALMSKLLLGQKKYLPTVIFGIDVKRNLRLKLRYFDWFIRLTSGKKYGPFIFVIGHVNYRTVVEVSGKLKYSNFSSNRILFKFSLGYSGLCGRIYFHFRPN